MFCDCAHLDQFVRGQVLCPVAISGDSLAKHAGSKYANTHLRTSEVGISAFSGLETKDFRVIFKLETSKLGHKSDSLAQTSDLAHNIFVRNS